MDRKGGLFVEEVHDRIEGDIVVENELLLHGMVTGNVIVKESGSLFLHGMVIGNLTVESGGNVELHGTVCHDVYNRGGYLKVFGVVDGILFDDSEHTYLDGKCIVKGRIIKQKFINE